MTRPMIMTPGPTYVREDVRRMMSMELTNPDIDIEFYDVYKNTCEKLQKVMKTENDVLILCGEGILGLEAACASLTEDGDRILVIDNGIFGNGFADYVEMYGGEAIIYKGEYDRGININDLKKFLEKDSDFKYATLVHCETPSGISNDVSKICPLLKSYGILTVVDSVSGIGGENVETDKWQMDIVLGGSQKCLSAPVGLSFLSISSDAWNMIDSRKTKIKSFYCNLEVFKGWYENKWFPYTMPNHLIYALDKALDNILEKDWEKLHSKIAQAVRYAVTGAGLTLYPRDYYANTLTAVNIPDGTTFNAIYQDMLDKHNIMIGGSFGYLKDKIIRIGHMGENCSVEKVFLTLLRLDEVLSARGIELKKPMHKLFIDKIGEE